MKFFQEKKIAIEWKIEEKETFSCCEIEEKLKIFLEFEIFCVTSDENGNFSRTKWIYSHVIRKNQRWAKKIFFFSLHLNSKKFHLQFLLRKWRQKGQRTKKGIPCTKFFLSLSLHFLSHFLTLKINFSPTFTHSAQQQFKISENEIIHEFFFNYSRLSVCQLFSLQKKLAFEWWNFHFKFNEIFSSYSALEICPKNIYFFFLCNLI